MHLRTALTLLKRVVHVFPSKSDSGEKILEALAPLQVDENPMQDIKAMAQAYSSQIMKSRDDGVWKEESASTKARREEEKRLQEERKKATANKYEAFKKESEQSEKIGQTGRGGRNYIERPIRRPQVPVCLLQK